MEHFDLTGKHAAVLHAETPAGAAIAAAYREAGATVADVATAAQIGALDTLDVLACAPDMFYAQPLDATTDDALLAVLQGNLLNQFAAVRAAAPRLGEGGRIVLLTSVLGQRGLPACAAYCAAQGAVTNLVRALAQELAPRGISVNGIALGWMDWMGDRIDPTDEQAGRAVRFTISKRAGSADDVGPLALWLSGSGAGFVSGQIFATDGGLLQHL